MGPVGDAEFVTNYETYMRYDGRSKAKTVQQLIDKSKDLADTNTPVNPARIGSARKVAHFGSWPSMER